MDHDRQGGTAPTGNGGLGGDAFTEKMSDGEGEADDRSGATASTDDADASG